MSYSLRDYAGIIGDKARIDAYREAMRYHIDTSSVVLDLGSGTGIFALMACELGAKRVYAVESNPAIQVGPKLAADNGYADRIEFFEIDSCQLELSEQVDLVVGDVRGVLPMLGNSLQVVSDAANRLLKPSGHIIPQRDFIEVALISSEKIWHEAVAPYRESQLSFDLTALRDQLSHCWMRSTLRSEDLVSDPVLWRELSYRDALAADWSQVLSLCTKRPATIHGFSTWFRTVLADGVEYASGPDASVTSYDSAFFPFPRPIEMNEGEEIEIDLRANLIGNEYLWRWNTTLRGKSTDIVFEQSTFYSDLISQVRHE